VHNLLLPSSGPLTAEEAFAIFDCLSINCKPCRQCEHVLHFAGAS
jgi:hypothetical protein